MKISEIINKVNQKLQNGDDPYVELIYESDPERKVFWSRGLCKKMKVRHLIKTITTRYYLDIESSTLQSLKIKLEKAQLLDKNCKSSPEAYEKMKDFEQKLIKKCRDIIENLGKSMDETEIKTPEHCTYTDHLMSLEWIEAMFVQYLKQGDTIFEKDSEKFYKLVKLPRIIDFLGAIDKEHILIFMKCIEPKIGMSMFFIGAIEGTDILKDAKEGIVGLLEEINKLEKKISEKYVLTPVRRSETDGDATEGDVGCIVMG